MFLDGSCYCARKHGVCTIKLAFKRAEGTKYGFVAGRVWSVTQQFSEVECPT